MKRYDHKSIEKKWQSRWKESGIFKTADNENGKKYYILDMFPYPSGVGLHVGHPKGYIATDIISRHKRMQGYEVLHPMGWDAFGLPAENYALKNKVHPSVAVKENIATFKQQLSLIGFDHDWSREIDTTDPEYYKWTQWVFVQMFKKGLAFESNEPINWCPSCKTGLANEDLEQGKCERCGSDVEQRPIRQWVLRITDYADRLLEGLDNLDWEDSIKEMQRNWIGRKDGAEIDFKISNSRFSIPVFTTRPDTIFGATYMVLAPEHPLISNLKSQISNWEEVEIYIKNSRKKTELERTDLAKEKTGVELKGIKAINPASGEDIPVWIADYVLAGYGTGAIMAVPAHDERDWGFAQKYKLPVKQVVAPLFSATGDHPDAIRHDKKTVTRNNVYVMVKHWDKDAYLCLDCTHADHWRSFVVGGVNENESIIEAAKRELVEETGYRNIATIREIPNSEIHSSYYAGHKGVNRYGKCRVVYMELADGEQSEMFDEEKEKHDLVWVDEKDVASFQSFGNLLHAWKVFRGEVTAYTGDGVVINSDFLNNLSVDEAKTKVIDWLEKEGSGKRAVTYRLKDWVFSRQRYWGEPIPIVHCEKCGAVPVPEDQLPVMLPEVERYEPTDTGESPLANIDEWVNTTCPLCGGPGKRETNTMPQWAGSCWYYLRYIDPHNSNAFVDKDKEKKWSPVDLYVGGAEHATRHLIYSRFWHKFLYDIGAVHYDEPFTRLQHVGLILAEDGRKMSKRWGNVINPDDIVEKFGADTLRLYEMFAGPFEQSVTWNSNGIIGVRKFIERVLKLQEKVKRDFSDSDDTLRLLHKTIKKVTQDIEKIRFNTAISQMMILSNHLAKEESISKETFESFVAILAPFAPHVTEEMWQKLGNDGFLALGPWPDFDESLAMDDEVEWVFQINGKVRDKVMLPGDVSEEEAKNKALESDKVRKTLGDKKPKKIIFVRGKLVNIVA